MERAEKIVTIGEFYSLWQRWSEAQDQTLMLKIVRYKYFTTRPVARPPDWIMQLVGEGRRRKYGGIEYREGLNGCIFAGEEGEARKRRAG